ncbi:hypothetical protein LAZ67_X003686 [Cordylochernes scorpioides]|uniref:Uncharacterized protein n=1 Tax=Cordylochernes scorpioides TaxID=51811 RepID=A0ABY6LWW5_9ARAC|nr:hypothetical protein LAZ67_X003686 [Cordylochernes scorpioides]
MEAECLEKESLPTTERLEGPVNQNRWYRHRGNNIRKKKRVPSTPVYCIASTVAKMALPKKPAVIAIRWHSLNAHASNQWDCFDSAVIQTFAQQKWGYRGNHRKSPYHDSLILTNESISSSRGYRRVNGVHYFIPMKKVGEIIRSMGADIAHDGRQADATFNFKIEIQMIFASSYEHRRDLYSLLYPRNQAIMKEIDCLWRISSQEDEDGHLPEALWRRFSKKGRLYYHKPFRKVKI